eukprot:12408646-Karenia_brevis.AAC.1
MRRFQLQSGMIKQVFVLKCVGVKLLVNGLDTARDRLSDRIDDGMRVAGRLRWSPLPFEARAILLHSLVLPRGLYGCLVCPVSMRLLGKFRTAVLKALWGNGRGRRCAEIVFTLMCQGHLTDPKQAVLYQRLVALQKLLKSRADVRPIFSALWSTVRARQRDWGPLGLIQEAVD